MHGLQRDAVQEDERVALAGFQNPDLAPGRLDAHATVDDLHPVARPGAPFRSSRLVDEGQ
jgi:hypothetical protein